MRIRERGDDERGRKEGRRRRERETKGVIKTDEGTRQKEDMSRKKRGIEEERGETIRGGERGGGGGRSRWFDSKLLND